MEGLLARVVMFGSWVWATQYAAAARWLSASLFCFPAPAMQHTGKEIKCNMNFLDAFVLVSIICLCVIIKTSHQLGATGKTPPCLIRLLSRCKVEQL